MSLRIRKATKNDKDLILAFCQNTFSWGDYIASVWDMWFKEGQLVVIEDNGTPLGMCHAHLSKNQVWIEGLRVNPSFRRHGLATSLVNHLEKYAMRKGSKVSRMLIAQENKVSLRLARSLGYRIESKWWLYYTKPKKQKSEATPVSNLTVAQTLNSQIFSESWRWYELDRQIITKLFKKRKIITFKNAIGIWNKSGIDDGIVQIGYLSGTKSGIQEILKFIQNKGYSLKARRIQILVQDGTEIGTRDVDKIMPFYLLKRALL